MFGGSFVGLPLPIYYYYPFAALPDSILLTSAPTSHGRLIAVQVPLHLHKVLTSSEGHRPPPLAQIQN